MNLKGDGTYIYNSAPSTLPIFLVAPFSASRRFVTKKIKLDEVISAALQQVVSTLQADGDKATFWIDTTGWLCHKTDFIPPDSETPVPEQPKMQRMLTPLANYKVSCLLADHICPYIYDGSKIDGFNGMDKQCQFRRYDNYLGNVYLPQNVEFDRAVLERKIARIKERFHLQKPAFNVQLKGDHRSMGETTSTFSFSQKRCG